MDGYKIYLDGHLFPVSPENIVIKIKDQNKSVNLIDGSEFTLINPAGLTQFSLKKIMLPNVAYDFAYREESTNELMGSNYYLSVLENIKNSCRPVTLVINRSQNGLCNDSKPIDTLVTLTSYTVTETADEGMNVLVDIELKRYVEHGLTRAVVTNNMVEKPKRTEKETETTTYTVKKGDTLWAIAKKFYGDGSRCWYLGKLNNLANPNILKVGQVLKIGPTAEAKASKATAYGSSTSSSSKKTEKTEKKNNEQLKVAMNKVTTRDGETPLFNIDDETISMQPKPERKAVTKEVKKTEEPKAKLNIATVSTVTAKTNSTGAAKLTLKTKTNDTPRRGGF